MNHGRRDFQSSWTQNPAIYSLYTPQTVFGAPFLAHLCNRLGTADGSVRAHVAGLQELFVLVGQLPFRDAGRHRGKLFGFRTPVHSDLLLLFLWYWTDQESKVTQSASEFSRLNHHDLLSSLTSWKLLLSSGGRRPPSVSQRFLRQRSKSGSILLTRPSPRPSETLKTPAKQVPRQFQGRCAVPARRLFALAGDILLTLFWRAR